MAAIKRILPVALTVFLLLCLPPSVSGGSGGGRNLKRAREILNRIDDLWRASSSHGVMTMRIVTSHYQRNLKLEEWSRGKDESLIRILAPAKEKNIATLKSGNTIYTYLPRTDRTIRLTSSMMMGSWMGSHFTNDDLVKESRLADDYDPEIVFEGLRNGIDLIEIYLRPHPDAAVVWDRIELEVKVDRGRDIPLLCRYYDEDGQLVRTLVFSEPKFFGKRLVPAVMRVVPAGKPGEFTEIRYQTLEFGMVFDDYFFSVNHLRRR